MASSREVIVLVAIVSAGCTQSTDSTSQGASTPQAGVGAAVERGGQEEFGAYELVEGWLQPLANHDGWTWGSIGAIYAETPDRIWIGQRGELPLPKGAKPFTPYGMLDPPQMATSNAGRRPDAPGRGGRFHHVLFVVDRDGKVVQEWSQHDALFDKSGGRGPHRIRMSPYDPDKHVWVVDDDAHAMFKFTYDGKLVMTLGEVGKPGRGPNNFARPTDIAWLPDGTFFMSDGYEGTRVAKFDKDGKFLMDWGAPPVDPAKPGPNEWNTVHGIAVSKDRRVYALDRGHRRIQVFDENGKFLFMFPTGLRSSPYSHIITEDGYILLGDGGTERILTYDLEGKFLYGWGSPGRLLGQFDGPHQVTVDQDRNLYVAEVFNGRVQKFRPKPNADPAKLVGADLRYPVG
jgi:hypothetical protein